MRFALEHAQLYDKKRVIAISPYISITDQTASVYKDFFKKEGVVLEHHSSLRLKKGYWDKLAAENWDAPVIVSTMVRLVETLAAASVSKSRRLHRLANSVLIIDEAQQIPVDIVEPLLDILKCLSKEYNTTIIISTATQPAFEKVKTFEEIDDLIEWDNSWNKSFSRVKYNVQLNSELSSSEVVEACQEKGAQFLIVTNSKKDAQGVFESIDTKDKFCLSTSLCPVHRAKVMNQIKKRLANNEACSVVSTQMIEAGVDLDFPFVARDIAPMDSIIQAAGRCNRNANINQGEVLVFKLSDHTLPQGDYKKRTVLTESILLESEINDESVKEFYETHFQTAMHDKRGIQELREKLNYPEVAKKLRMIDSVQCPVLIMYQDHEEEIRQMLFKIKQRPELAKFFLRLLQPYTVNLSMYQYENQQTKGLLEIDKDSGAAIWRGRYDSDMGLVLEGDLDDFIL